jgi:hypothetical protein
MIRKFAAAAAAIALVLSLGSQAALAAPAGAHAAGLAHAAGVAHATRPTVSQDRALIARRVRRLLKYNPGARQISFNAVRYKGAILGVSVPGQSRSSVLGSESGFCPDDYLCLFWDANWGQGTLAVIWIKFYNCNVNYDLYNYRINEGVSWADETSSIDYPGSADGHEAKFNHDGDWWLYLYRDHYLADLVYNGGPNPQHNSNDWITGLYVC